MSDDRCSIGIDLGGTKVEIAIVNSTGTILYHEKLTTHVEAGPGHVIEEVVQSASNIINKHRDLNIAALGTGVAGQISANGCDVLFAPNLKWRNVPLKSILESQLSLPCKLLNDVRAATWGEWLHGAGKDCQDFICLFLGTGIGGGIVTGGRLLEGYSNTAGELGHTTLREGGRLCSCGHRGCLEAYVGGWGIAATLKEAAASSPHHAKALLRQVDGDASLLRAEHLSKAVKEGDPFSNDVYNQIINSLAHGCVTFVNAINPRKLIFGGGVALGMPDLIERTAVELKRSALGAAAAHIEIIPTKLGSSAAVIGAAAAGLRG